MRRAIAVKRYRKAIERTSVGSLQGSWKRGENADPQQLLCVVEEEIGYTADLELLYDFYSAIGFYDERIKLYGATNEKGGKSRPPKIPKG